MNGPVRKLTFTEADAHDAELMLGPEWLRLPSGARHQIGGQEREGGQQLEWPGAKHLREFRLEEGLPVWLYELDGHVVEKHVLMVHSQNTVHVNYRLVEGEGPLRL